MGPPAHLEQFVVKLKIEAAPTEFQIQAHYDRRLGHLKSHARGALRTAVTRTARVLCVAGYFVYQVAHELAWNISTLSGTSFGRRETVSQALVSVVKMLVGKQRQIQQSRQRIVCSHQRKFDRPAQGA